MVSNSAGQLPPGIDVRYNGYIVLAPSTVLYRGDDAVAKGVEDGFEGRYRWQPSPWDMPPQPLPEFVLEMLKPRQEPRPSSPPPTNGYHVPSDKDSGYARAALEREVEMLRRTPEGNRNNQLNASAFSLGQLVASGGC